jgi:hypothetical protein
MGVWGRDRDRALSRWGPEENSLASIHNGRAAIILWCAQKSGSAGVIAGASGRDRPQCDRELADIEAAMMEFERNPVHGLIVPPDPTTNSHRKTIVALAARYRVPAIYAYRAAVVDGGLISYGVDIPHLFRQAATYVDRVLRGEKPADLPVQQPTKFELVINLKTAKALVLDIPTSLLARADEVIE